MKLLNRFAGLPWGGRLGFLAAALSLVVLVNGPGSLIFTAVLVGAAVALSAQRVGVRLLGAFIEAVPTVLGAFEGWQVVDALRQGTELPRFFYFWLFGQFLLGTVVIAVALAGLPGLARRTGWWGGAKLAAAIAFSAAAYWFLLGIADALWSANLPDLLRVFMAPGLSAGFALIGAGLRSPRSGRRDAAAAAAGLLLAVTIGYWIDDAPLLGFGAPFSGGPGLDSSYATALPWPLLMAAGVVLNLAVLAAWARHRFWPQLLSSLRVPAAPHPSQ